jgi:uncharacterized small protein (DUF1192 family)
LEPARGGVCFRRGAGRDEAPARAELETLGGRVLGGLDVVGVVELQQRVDGLRRVHRRLGAQLVLVARRRAEDGHHVPHVWCLGLAAARAAEEIRHRSTMGGA